MGHHGELQLMGNMLGGGPDFSSLKRLAATFGKESPVIAKCGMVLEKAIKEQLSHPGSGRVYPARKGRGQHQASAPGESPAPDLGDLRKSIGQEVVGGIRRVGTGLARAAALEFGHVYADGRVLAPRPYMRPAAKRSEKDMTGAAIADLEIRGKGVGLGD